MNTQEIKQGILSMRNNAIYQELSASYATQNIFNILKVERHENRHSAFLCWLFNPTSDHGLGVEPIKKLLALYSYNKSSEGHLGVLMLSGNYTIDVEECSTEKVTGNLLQAGSQDRIDIWMRLTLTDSEGNKYLVPVVIENKVSAVEGKEQTIRYHEAIEAFCKNEGADDAVEIFLTPYEGQTSSSPSFTHLTYQQLLDDVLSPLSAYSMPESAESIINAYIQTLCTPVMGADDKITDPNMLVNSIMAISKAQKEKLRALYEEYKDLYNMALTIAGGDKAEAILGRLVESTEDAMLLQNFWDSNITLFNTILYVCCEDIASGAEQQKQLMDVFKTSRRDTSKYMVLWDESGDGTNWVPVRGYERPMSKAKTVAVFFEKWMKLNAPKTIDELRDIFPTSLNTYYARFAKKGVFDSVIWFTADDVTAETASGFKVNIADASWDLYPVVGGKSHDTSFGLGYGPVYEGLTEKGKAMIVKMWRKDDFESLLSYIQENQQKYFSRIKIEEQ